MQITFGAKTDVGLQRERNEDNFLIDAALSLFVVCDGMGGHAGGDIASAAAVAIIREHIASYLPPIPVSGQAPLEPRHVLQVVGSSVHLANQKILERAKQNPAHHGMGTTVSMVLVRNGRAFIGHVGDSRVYLVRNGTMYQLTSDHSFINEVLKHGGGGNARDINPRIGNTLTRAVGVRKQVDTDVLQVDLLPNDRLLICSDGLYNFADHDDIQSVLTSGEPEGAICQTMIEQANRQGGADNITAVVIRVAPTADGRKTDAQRKLEAVRSAGIFRHLSYTELLRALSVTEDRHVPAGAAIFMTGEVEDSVYVILNGSVAFRQSGNDVTTLSKGHHFGELALVDNTPRSVDAIAVQDTQLVVLRRSGFYELLRGDPLVANKLLWSLVKALTVRLHSVADKMQLIESLYHSVDDGLFDRAAPEAWVDPGDLDEMPPPLPPSKPEESS